MSDATHFHDTPLILDAPPAPPERRPGDFRRDANGTPWVSHPDGERTKPKRKGDEGHVKSLRYSRPSGFGEQILDSYNLQKWSERMIVAGFAYGLGTSVPVDRLEALAPADNDNEQWRKEADRIVKLAKERAKYMLAADRGTHAHGLTEQHDLERDYIAMLEEGAELGISEQVQHALVGCWKAMLDRYGLQILATELPVVHDGYRCAGTLDRIVRLTKNLTFVLPGGELVTLTAGTVLVLDLKTGKLRHTNGEVSWWDNYPIQIAIYAGGTGYDVDAEERRPLPWDVNQRWAIIAHLDVLGAIDGNPSCELILVDLELGRAGADLVLAAKRYAAAEAKFSLVGTCQIAEPATTRPDPHKHGNDFGTATVTAPTRPDEGETPVDIEGIRKAYDALPEAGRKWIGQRAIEARQALTPFNLSELRSERRAGIMGGLVALAANDAADDESLRAIVRFVTTDDAAEWPTIPPGASLGTLGAEEATLFAATCRAYVGGMLAFDFTSGKPTLVEVK